VALYFLSIKPISRTQRSAVEAAAYRSGEKLYDERKEEFFDFTRKKGIIHTEVLLPENAPPEFSNREILWNAAEHAEKRRDSRIAREIELALPRELTLETSKALVRKFVSVCFIPLGMCTDICIHAGLNKNTNHNETERKKLLPHNPHAHIMFTDRPVGKEGFCNKKNPDWNSKQYLNQWRECWANLQNETFVRKGLAVRVSHQSYKNRDIDREPTKHLGPIIMAIERRNIKTKLGNENRAIEARNKEKQQLQLVREPKRRFEISR
jgi:ATP-dependent exoDNAse (exonuclease V) alpha subunit